MYPNNGYNVYKNNSVNYASKEQLLLMLVDGAVKFAKRAEKDLLDKNIVQAHENLTRTQDIMIELMASLDRSAGAWAKQLFSVYEFINYKLGQANIKKDVELLKEVLPLIEDVRSLWHDVYKKSKAAGE